MIYRTATTADGEVITLTARGGKGAHCYAFGVGTTAFTGEGVGLRRELLALGCKPWQSGDKEFTVLFPESLTDEVFRVAQVRRSRKGVTPQHLAKFWFKAGVEVSESVQIQANDIGELPSHGGSATIASGIGGGES